MASLTSNVQSDEQCRNTEPECPAPKISSARTGSVTLCAKAEELDEEALHKHAQMYSWGQSKNQRPGRKDGGNRESSSVMTIPAGLAWNTWPSSNGANCGSSCTDAYTEMVLAYSDSKGWPVENGVPIVARGGTSRSQFEVCRQTVLHHLGGKPKGAYVEHPFELLEAVLRARIVINVRVWEQKEQGDQRSVGYV